MSFWLWVENRLKGIMEVLTDSQFLFAFQSDGVVFHPDTFRIVEVRNQVKSEERRGAYSNCTELAYMCWWGYGYHELLEDFQISGVVQLEMDALAKGGSKATSIMVSI